MTFFGAVVSGIDLWIKSRRYGDERRERLAALLLNMSECLSRFADAAEWTDERPGRFATAEFAELSEYCEQFLEISEGKLSSEAQGRIHLVIRYARLVDNAAHGSWGRELGVDGGHLSQETIRAAREASGQLRALGNLLRAGEL